MRRYLTLGSILAGLLFVSTPFVSPVAEASQGSKRTWTETPILTRAVPTLASEGMDLGNIDGFRVSVCAASGQTLSGGGNLNAYLYNYDTALWQRNPGLDWAISVTATSCSGALCRCQVFPDQVVAAALGSRVLYAPNAVTISSGTTVVVRIDGWAAN